MLSSRVTCLAAALRAGCYTCLALGALLTPVARGDQLTKPGDRVPSKDDPSTWLNAPVLGEREARLSAWKEQLDQRGAHGSGLDRFAVIVALDDGRVSEARRLIKEAAEKGGGEEVESQIVIELYSTDVFAPFVDQLREISDQIVKERRRDRGEPAGWSVRRLRAELLAGYMAENILNDEVGSEAHYRKVEQAGKGRMAQSADDAEIEELSAGAKRRLAELESRAGNRARHDR